MEEQGLGLAIVSLPSTGRSPRVGRCCFGEAEASVTRDERCCEVHSVGAGSQEREA